MRFREQLNSNQLLEYFRLNFKIDKFTKLLLPVNFSLHRHDPRHVQTSGSINTNAVTKHVVERTKASFAIKIRRITVNNFSNFYLSKLITKRSSPSNLKRPFKEDLEKESFNLKKQISIVTDSLLLDNKSRII